jgi:hypothetical protein
MEQLTINFKEKELIKLDYNLAKRAYDGISFDSEKRAEYQVKWFNESLLSDYNDLLTLSISEPQKEVFNIEFERYQQKFKSMYENYLSAKSRTISPMITGPANFPVRRNEKALNSERKRYDEFSQWLDRAFKAIKKKINEAKTGEQKAKDIEEGINKNLEYLFKQSESVIKCIGGLLPYSPTLLKNSLERKIINFAKDSPDLAVNVVNSINARCQERFNKDVYTSKHPILSKIEAIKAEKNKSAEIKNNTTIVEFNGVTVISNEELNRIQILFPGKPSEEIRNLLKSNSFKWAPSQSAWQRQTTSNAIYCTKIMIPRLKELTN